MDQRSGQAEPHHLLLYDGECGFCHAVVRFVLAHDRRRAFRFAALQSAAAGAALAPFGGRPADLSTFYVIQDHRGDTPALHSRSGAALFVAQSLGWPWSMTNVFRVLPRPWRDAAYAIVARHRHRILGPAEACLLPGPEDRDRFLDAGEGAPR
jgi:predicted DCC family thiol-disulfide oxidoreductase YuxK